MKLKEWLTILSTAIAFIVSYHLAAMMPITRLGVALAVMVFFGVPAIITGLTVLALKANK